MRTTKKSPRTAASTRSRARDPSRLSLRATPSGWRIVGERSAKRRIAVLFDLDGVLINSYRAWFALVNDARRAFGRPPIDLAAFDAGGGQGVDADVDRYFRGLTVERVGGYFDAHFMDHVGEVRVMPGARELLARLRERGLPTAIVTNTPRAIAADVLSFKGLFELVDELVGADEVEHAKPAPDLVVEACRRLDVEPGRSVLVGDSTFDRDAARRAGVLFIGYGGIEGDATLARLADLADRI